MEWKRNPIAQDDVSEASNGNCVIIDWHQEITRVTVPFNGKGKPMSKDEYDNCEHASCIVIARWQYWGTIVFGLNAHALVPNIADRDEIKRQVEAIIKEETGLEGV